MGHSLYKFMGGEREKVRHIMVVQGRKPAVAGEVVTSFGTRVKRDFITQVNTNRSGIAVFI
jgi:hypothetical protein